MNKHCIALLSIITISITACGSSPKVRFYTLNATDSNMSNVEEVVKTSNIAVKLGSVSIPETLMQPRIVTRSGANQLILDEFNRWGGDFQEDVQRILAENISILLPSEHVILNQDRSPLAPDFLIIVNVREFAGELGGLITLKADWSITAQGKTKTVTAKKSVLHAQAPATDYPSYVSTQSKLLTKLSQEIVAALKAQ